MPDQPADRPSPPPSPSGGNDSSSGSGGASTPIGARRSPWVPVGIAVLAVVAVVLAVVLLVDPFGDGGAEGGGTTDGTAASTTLSEEARRAEVVAAVENYFARLEEAYAANDFGLVEGLYTPESEAARTQRTAIEGLAAEGVASRGTTAVEIGSVQIEGDRAEVEAQVTLTAQFVDAESGAPVGEPAPPTTDQLDLTLRRVDSTWLVEDVRRV